MTCAACGSENRPGRKFCTACGAALSLACPACGAAHELDDVFCGECGAALARRDDTAPAQPDVERRRVSVLFADLVGSTAIAEGRDAEEVRELLTRYFDAARRVVERYGGTVEKFIGDAVMAVWGTPVAQEDDSERAVRAGLDLVETVAELQLVARVGVLTGEAAVNVGATGQAMVAGDLVNAASRVQSLAEGGTVLVGESTYRATRASIAYAEAGVHEVKGRDEPVELWRALRVTGRVAGALKSDLLEPPFVGRSRELRLVKELFHGSADARRAQLVAVLGVAGLGKSRLAWELAKYLDGLTQQVLWHRGRCLAYGDGVTYSAFAEMMRMRCGIAEGEPARSARQKLVATLEEFVADDEERRWLEPRLAHLLALEDRSGADDADLFAAWRLFLERLAEVGPVVLVFEDMQWADAALLAFVEHLLEWSAAQPILVLALGRPELAERHPGWPQGRVNVSRVALEPLEDEAMRELVAGVVPGLPAELADRVVERAEGIPLYAVETLRMLVDRGLLEREGEQYRLTGAVGELETPETLHALIAARLDGLEAGERRVLEAAAVLGKTFTPEALAPLAPVGGEELRALLDALVRKEVLFLQADPRSPERGQYAFVQDLLRQVAYETLSRKERRGKHLAVAAWLEEHRDDADVVEVVAAHYAAAYESDPGAADAPATRDKAAALLVRAGERAASLAAPADAQRYFERALELTEGPAERAALHERIGSIAVRAGELEAARNHYDQAIAGFKSLQLGHATARASAGLANQIFLAGDLAAAVACLEAAYGVLAEGDVDADAAEAASQLARFLVLSGRHDDAVEPLERALAIAESLGLPEMLSHALNTKSLVLSVRGRREEARALLEHALKIALEHELWEAAGRAYNNLAVAADTAGDFEAASACGRAYVELAQRLGHRPVERRAREMHAGGLAILGRWDEALAVLGDGGLAPAELVELYAARGELEAARRLLEDARATRELAGPQHRAYLRTAEAILLLAEARPADALAAARAALSEDYDPDNFHWHVRTALDAAFAASDAAAVDEFLAEIDRRPRGVVSPFLAAIHARGAARRAALAGDVAAEELYVRAARGFRESSTPHDLAWTLLDYGEWLAAEDRHEEAAPLLAEAAEIFERLGAGPWLERARAALGTAAPAWPRSSIRSGAAATLTPREFE